MKRIATVLLALLTLCSAALAADEADIAAAIKEKNGSATGRTIRIAGEWALADELSTADPPARTARALMRKVNEHWVVSAELAGTGEATSEALAYHEVPPTAIKALLDRRARDTEEPILALLRQMMPETYPEGYLFENVVVAENWSICFYRRRASLKKSDHPGQALLRLTGGKWHLVEKIEDGALDLKQYGVSLRLQRILNGMP